MSLSTRACFDGAIILAMRTCFWCGGWPFRLPSLPRQQKHRETKNPTCLFNRTGDFVDWHGDIMPLGRRKLKLVNLCLQSFLCPQWISYFDWYAQIGMWVTWNSQSIHTSANVSLIGPSFSCQVQTTSSVGRKSGHPPKDPRPCRSWKPQVDRTLVGLELFWLWGGLSLHSNETGPQGSVAISQIQRHSEP